MSRRFACRHAGRMAMLSAMAVLIAYARVVGGERLSIARR
jgi:hypothetical protein